MLPCSSSERQLLLIAASIAEGRPVDLLKPWQFRSWIFPRDRQPVEWVARVVPRIASSAELHRDSGTSRSPKRASVNGCLIAPASAGPRWTGSTSVFAAHSPTSTRTCPTVRSCRCVACATAAQPASGDSPSTAPATTTTKTHSCPPALRPQPRRRPRLRLRPLPRRTHRVDRSHHRYTDELTIMPTSREEPAGVPARGKRFWPGQPKPVSLTYGAASAPALACPGISPFRPTFCSRSESCATGVKESRRLWQRKTAP